MDISNATASPLTAANQSLLLALTMDLASSGGDGDDSLVLTPSLVSPRCFARTVRSFLVANSLLDVSLLPLVTDTTIAYAISDPHSLVTALSSLTEPLSPEISEIFHAPLVDSLLRRKPNTRGCRKGHSRSFTELARKFLTPDEFSYFHKSFEVVGSIATITVPEELVHRQREIASCLLQSIDSSPRRPIHTVAKKVATCNTAFRLSGYEILGGEETLETCHRENGLAFHLDLSKVFFSARISTERQRLCRLVTGPEVIFVPFSGVGLFSIVVAKRATSGLCHVVSLEMNPDAAEFARRNVIENGAEANVGVFQGDVREEEDVLLSQVVPLGRLWAQEQGRGDGVVFDRIIAPMPRTDNWKELFLPILRCCSRAGTKVHLYDHLNARDVEERIDEIVSGMAEEGIELSLERWLRVGAQHSPTVVRVCYDFTVN